MGLHVVIMLVMILVMERRLPQPLLPILFKSSMIPLVSMTMPGWKMIIPVMFPVLCALHTALVLMRAHHLLLRRVERKFHLLLRLIEREPAARSLNTVQLRGILDPTGLFTV